MTPASENIPLFCADGRTLRATTYGQSSDTWILICGAMGVPQRFYRHFAHYLANNGFGVLTFDYRGIGRSYQKEDFANIRLQEWGEHDIQAAIKYLQTQYPDCKILCVAHSVGGQLLGLAHNNHLLNGVLAVACSSGYWGHWQGINKAKIFFAWYFLMPVVTRIFKQLPKWVLGGEALPPKVARQWAFWGRNRHYICDKKGQKWRPFFNQIQAAMSFYAFSDDVMLSPLPAVRNLTTFYENSTKTIEIIQPEDFSCKKLAHMGFFQVNAPDELWQKALRDLQRF